MMKELKKEYIENLPDKISKIENFHNKKDVDGLLTAFHQLKGTGKTYGVPEVSTLGKIVEFACKKNKNVFEIVPKGITLLKKIEQNRKKGNEYLIESDQDYLEIKKLAA